jgi:CheY-like chemotaxis protein
MTRLAVVEDNPDNRLLVAAILEDDYDLTEYECGTSALAGMQIDRPDLVLMDISLPGMDGVQVLQAMRTLPELIAVPVIALTAHAMSGDRERFLTAGFNGYVTKPILDEDLLIGAIEGLLADGALGLRRSA